MSSKWQSGIIKGLKLQFEELEPEKYLIY